MILCSVTSARRAGPGGRGRFYFSNTSMSPSAPSIRNTVPTTSTAPSGPISTADAGGDAEPAAHSRARQHLAQPPVVAGIEVRLHHPSGSQPKPGIGSALEDAAGELAGALGGGGDRHHHPAVRDLPRQRLGGRRVGIASQQMIR